MYVVHVVHHPTRLLWPAPPQPHRPQGLPLPPPPLGQPLHAAVSLHARAHRAAVRVAAEAAAGAAVGRAQQLPIHAGSQVQQQAGPRRSLAAAAAAAVEAPPERARLRRSAHPQQPGAPQPWQQQRQEHARQQHPRQTWQQQQQLLQPREQRQQRGRVQFSLGSEQDWSLPTGLAVTWLGTSSGTPSRERNISCTLVRMPQSVFMVDCGEGSHRQAALTGVALEQVDTIFVTHLHGDHCFGIGGMLISMCKARAAAREQQQAQQQQRRQQAQSEDPSEGPGALRLVGPPRLGQLVAAMLTGAGVARRLDLPVYITEFVEDARHAHGWAPLPGAPDGSAFLRCLAPEQLPPTPWTVGLQAQLARAGLDWQGYASRRIMFEARPGLVWRIACAHASVSAAQLQHRVPCWGYVFDEAAPAQQQQQQQSQQQQQPSGARRVLILGDTVDSRAIAALAQGADLVSHEATFAAGMEAKAATAQHSTAWMAGRFAAAIQARALVLTHFSARYEGNAGDGGSGGRLGGGPPGRRLPQGGGPGQHRQRAWEAAEEAVRVAAAEEAAVASLAREAEAEFAGGPVFLARDLFTTHVPAREAGGGAGE